jgi:hypothetical protein
VPSRHSRKLEHSPESLLLEQVNVIIEITIINNELEKEFIIISLYMVPVQVLI